MRWGDADLPGLLPGLLRGCLPVLVWRAPAPHTYTGQEVAEIVAVGNPLVLRRVEQGLVAAGARRAGPGEFTFRAFRNGRMSLTEAEGVQAVIGAGSMAQLAAADRLKSGRLGHLAESMADELATLLALVEAGIDFVDQEDVVPIAPGALCERLTTLDARLERLLADAPRWVDLRGLPRVVFRGAPGAGKSALFNALLERRRAVVDADPGTTRDALEEPIAFALADEGASTVEALLVDLPGIGDPIDALDAEAQRRARAVLRDADVILHVQRPGRAEEALEGSVTEDKGSTPMIRVWTHADQHAAGESLVARDVTADVNADVTADVTKDVTTESVLRVSSVTGENLPRLRQAIAEAVAQRSADVAGDTPALLPRHLEELERARNGLAEAMIHLRELRPTQPLPEPELTAAQLRAALDALAGLGGSHSADDVIGRVFATFCVGK